MAVGLSAKQLGPCLNDINSESPQGVGELVISCVNSPCNTTVSGEQCRLTKLQKVLDGKGIFNRRLRVPVAYHSPQMEHIVPDCLQHFGKLESIQKDTNVKMISSVTGTILTKDRACEGSYWISNLLSPVLFKGAMERLCSHPVERLSKKLDCSHRNIIAVDHIIEIGPHAALRLPIQEIAQSLARANDITYFSALYRKQPASSTLLQMVGELHCRGLPVNLRSVNDPNPLLKEAPISLVDAPKYPFDHSVRYWAESPLVRNYRLREHGHWELLGSPSRDWNPLAPVWRCCVSTSDMPWVLEHKVNNTVLYPAAAMVVMATQGVLQISGRRQNIVALTLRDFRCESAILVSPGSDDLETRLYLRPLRRKRRINSSSISEWEFSVHSVKCGNWSENCHGIIDIDSCPSEDYRLNRRFYQEKFDLRSKECSRPVHSSIIYDAFNQQGNRYGPTFQGIRTAYHGKNGEVLADVSLDTPPKQGTDHECAFIIHPATLDSFFQVALVALSDHHGSSPTQAISRIDRLWISVNGLAPSGDMIHVSAKVENSSHSKILYSAFALDGKRELKLALNGLETTIIASQLLKEPIPEDNQYWYKVQTALDVNMLSGPSTLEWLHAQRGADAQGPIEFFHNLRKYLRFTVGKLRRDAEASGIDSTRPHLQRYVDWMETHVGSTDEHLTVEYAALLRARLEGDGFLGRFFTTVADHALSVLQGSSDMIQILFGSDNLAEQFYKQQLSGSLYYQKFQLYLESLCFKSPSMNYLEIGAGTGSFTKHILEAVFPRYTGAPERLSKYCFTDISPAFFEKAKQQFAGYSQEMEFAILDVDNDPEVQGFKDRSYDVIAASNVLHVTKDLDRTLQRLRRLLKPGGKLFIHEYVRPESIEVGFVFGLLPGWWPTTHDHRRMSPLSTEEKWEDLLRCNGFSGADLILRDFADDESHLMSIICSTAIEVDSEKPRPTAVIAIQGNSIYQKALVAALLDRISQRDFRNISVADISTFSPDRSPSDVLISLLDTDYAILSGMNEKIFETVKDLLHRFTKILWVSKGGGRSADPRHGMVDGFSRVFRAENIDAKFATLALELDPRAQVADAELIVSSVKQLMESPKLQHPDDHVVRHGHPTISRICEDSQFTSDMLGILRGEISKIVPVHQARPFCVSVGNAGSPSCLRVTRDTPSSERPEPYEVEIEVHATTLSGTDLSTALPRNQNGDIVSKECAGFVTRAGDHTLFSPGDRVCAYGHNALRSTLRIRSELVAKIPDAMNFEQAAVLPEAYVVANYILQEARIQPDDIVLVHGQNSSFAMATLSLLANGTFRTVVIVSQECDLLFLDTPHGTMSYFTEHSFARYCREDCSRQATIMLDFTRPKTASLNNCISPFGQYFRIWSAGEDDTAPEISIELPPTVGFKIIDTMEGMKHQFGKLKLPFHDFPETSWGLVQMPSKVLTLPVVENFFKTESPFGDKDRVVIRFDAHDQIIVSIGSERSSTNPNVRSGQAAREYESIIRCRCKLHNRRWPRRSWKNRGILDD